MRIVLYLALLLVACAGGQTHDPGGEKDTGGIAGSKPTGSGGIGGNKTTDSRGTSTVVNTEDEVEEAGGAGSTEDSEKIPRETTCGNGVLDLGEECDGTNLDGANCGTLITGSTGTLYCDNCEFDTSMCYVEDTGAPYGQ